MIPLRATLLMDAPEGAVRRVLCRTDIWTRTARALGARAEVAGERAGPRARLRTGDLIRLRADRTDRAGRSDALWPSRSLIVRVDIQPDANKSPLPSFDFVAGPLRQFRISLTTASTSAGTMVTLDCRVLTSPALLTPLLRRRVLESAQLLLGIALLAAREPEVVVAGAVIDEGRVLVARRTSPAAMAGFWELPGGKVNPGETEQVALAREFGEELGMSITVGNRLGADVDLGDNMVLRCYLVASHGDRPYPTEHDAVQWARHAELDALNWLEPDRSVLPDLRRHLGAEISI